MLTNILSLSTVIIYKTPTIRSRIHDHSGDYQRVDEITIEAKDVHLRG